MIKSKTKKSNSKKQNVSKNNAHKKTASQTISVTIPLETKTLLRALAKKYETKNFLNGDPSYILHEYKTVRDTETASFIMALLSFGKREQFLKKANVVFLLMNGEPFRWIKSGAWKNDFPSGKKKFYRFFSFDDMRDVFFALEKIFETEKSFGAAVKKKYEHTRKKENRKTVLLAPLIAEFFPHCKMISHAKNSPMKRLNLFAKWMVRTPSCVDAGLWKWYPKSALIIPLDTHVLSEAKKLHLLGEKRAANLQTALTLTKSLQRVWKDDPCKGDFALFGFGVDKEK